jgi:hypothetical protein
MISPNNGVNGQVFVEKGNFYDFIGKLPENG